MATRQQVKAWIEQADADLLAARAESADLRECHRRYWIQQAYEKAIKAFALMRWNGGVEEHAQFERLFLLQHSPLKTVAETNTPLSKALHLLEREVQSFVRKNLAGEASTLLKIDSTTPRNAPEEISYRYPFLVDGEYTAPTAYEDWDGYQGSFMAARGAVERLLRAVRDELKLFGLKPS
jgi:hypothetical protein